MEFIAVDVAGWNHLRYTHMPSGDTLLKEPWMGYNDWEKAQRAFFAKYPGLNIHSCPGAYTTEGKIVGKT